MAIAALGWCATSSAQFLNFPMVAIPERAADGSLVWGMPDGFQGDVFISGMADTFTITGGSGMATIAVPVHLDWTVRQYGMYFGAGYEVQSIDNAGDASAMLSGVAGLYEAAENHFAVHVEHSPNASQYDFVSYVQLPYNQPTDVAFSLGASPLIGPADQDFSNCGTPSETNWQCVRGGYIDLELSFSFGPLMIPQGTMLTSASNAWQVVTVLEPGAGLLMLAGLGVVTLARRRQAGARKDGCN
jgi:hypothetical protein